jgi:hypothetical protein
MYCANCGAEVEASGRFCNRCGRVAVARAVAPTKRTHPFVKFLAVIFGGFILLFVIGLIASSPKEGSSDTNRATAAPTMTATSRATTTSVKAAPAPTKAQQLALEIATRRAYAKVLDQQLLDLGIESKTYTTGTDAKTLVIEDALAGRVRVNALKQNSDLFDQIRTLGFKHLRYENGFEDELYFGVHWDF